jgi:hypothetical protein
MGSNVRRLLRLFIETRELRILGLVADVVHISKDTELPTEFADWLARADRSIELYVILFEIVVRIANKEAQRVWLEDILINLDLWDYHNTRLLSLWNGVLLDRFSDFFHAKSYFRYFFVSI